MPSADDFEAGERSPLLVRDGGGNDIPHPTPSSQTAASDQQPAQPSSSASGGTNPRRTAPAQQVQTPTQGLPKADTNTSWGAPLGLPVRGPNDENLVIFRRAVGINNQLAGASSDASTLEQGRRRAQGIYREVIRGQRSKAWQFAALSVLIYACHFAQILVGAALTALGPAAGDHAVAITSLGAINTVMAGVLALVKGQGLPERLRKDEVEFRRLQDWIEETEALLAVGVVGRDRREVGLLVEVAFKKYNAAKASEENNKPDSYVRQAPEGDRESGGGRRSSESGNSGNSGNAVVRLNMPTVR